jgi:hypothetical protein
VEPGICRAEHGGGGDGVKRSEEKNGQKMVGS